MAAQRLAQGPLLGHGKVVLAEPEHLTAALVEQTGQLGILARLGQADLAAGSLLGHQHGEHGVRENRRPETVEVEPRTTLGAATQVADVGCLGDEGGIHPPSGTMRRLA